MAKQKSYQVSVKIRGSRDESRDSGPWKIMKGSSAKQVLEKARKQAPKRFVITEVALLQVGE